MTERGYIFDILSLLCDGDDAGLAFRLQLPYLINKDILYTGSGVFIYFNHQKGILPHTYPGDPGVINGVKIRSSTPKIEAEAQFFVKDGLIDHLEIWCYYGDYPGEELKSYILTQEWEGSPAKRIEHNIPK